MVTNSNVENWYKRKNKIEIYTVYKESTGNSWDNKSRSRKEIAYKYWICDYCKMAIVIRDIKNKDQQDGGEFFIPATILRRGSVKVVSHNRCLNKLLAEIENYIESR